MTVLVSRMLFNEMFLGDEEIKALSQVRRNPSEKENHLNFATQLSLTVNPAEAALLRDAHLDILNNDGWGGARRALNRYIAGSGRKTALGRKLSQIGNALNR